MTKFIKAGLLALFVSLAMGRAAFAAGHAGQDYKLGPDDVISLTIANHEDLNRDVTVRPDGKITLPMGSEIMAAGKTATVLAAEIRVVLLRKLNNVEVGVSVKEAHAQRARIFGAVKAAGSYDIKSNWRVMDLIAMAGGLTARPNRITGRIVRPGGVVLSLDLDAAANRPGGRANVAVLPDDLVFLDEQATSRQIHVTGQVRSPGAFDLDENLTLIGLVAEAGGPTDSAALRKVYVSRGARQIHFDLYRALVEGQLDPDLAAFQFEPGDTVVVPENRRRVGIMGQVAKPGYYMLTEDLNAATASKTLALAGGQLTTADLEHAEISRLIDGTATKIPIDLDAVSRGDAGRDPQLEPGDILYLPQSQVRVLGKVGKPGAYNINDNVTLISLVADAGGLVPGAGAAKAYVMRGDSQLPVNLYLALSGMPDATVANFKLQNGDVLVVPDITNQIQVTGQVARPGLFDLEDNLTVASLLNSAGGVMDSGLLSKAYVTRGRQQIPLTQASPSPGAALLPENISFKFQAGDVLVIPQNPVRYAVIGQVTHQGYYSFPALSTSITPLSALTAAGGSTQLSDLRHAVIVRGDKTIALDLDPGHSKAVGDVQILPGDVVYVPAKSQKTNNMGSILGLASLLIP